MPKKKPETLPFNKKDSWLVFNKIAGTYDFINRILSFGVDKRWRKRTLDFIPLSKEITLVDIASGTFDLLIAILKKRPNITQAYAVDPSPNMLALGQKKLLKNISFYEKTKTIIAKAEKIPLKDKSSDIITVSFGIRNFTDVEKSLLEFNRILKKNGTLIILEFALPKNSLIKFFYLLYLRYFLPLIGGIFSKNISAYSYLNKTIETFPYGDALLEKLKQAGFKNTYTYSLTFGIANIYVGEKA